MTKRDAAKIMFLEGVSQGDIAQALATSENTVSRWKKQGGWEENRASRALYQETAVEKVWKLVNWNLSVLESRMEAMTREGDMQLIERGDIDALTKLFSAIKGKEKSWAHYVSTIREFLAYAQSVDLDVAKKILESNITDSFLNEKRQNM